MKYLIGAALLSVWAVTSKAEDIDPLAEYRWANRVLIAFANDERNPYAHSLERALAAARCELVDRDMVTGWILLKGNSRIGEATSSNEIDGLLRSGLGIRTGLPSAAGRGRMPNSRRLLVSRAFACALAAASSVSDSYSPVSILLVRSGCHCVELEAASG